MNTQLKADTSLVTEFVTVTIDQPDSIAVLPQTIINALQDIGDPLRWAITAVDTDQRKLHVEAVVMTSAAK
ncbi:MAG: hypothetical protein F6K09_11350 [Merismopedia sp. SIO2A8]|nr:hypothetical protein [Merismopedia sp. SIO2A8]